MLEEGRVRYSRFEVLALVLAIAVVLGAMLVGPTAEPEPAAVVGHLLVVVVLAGALHWGRNGGFAVALLSTLVYVYMRLPLLAAQGFTNDLVVDIGARVLTYGIVGVIGGEVCGRLKYLFARLDNNPMIDEVTGVYNARYAASAIRAGVAQWQRYEVPYSVVVLGLSPTLFDQPGSLRARALLRQVASHIRNDIRLVDDLAYAGDGRFFALFPQTPADGAAVACDRLHRGLTALLGVKEQTIEAVVHSCQRNATALRHLADELDPEPEAVTPARDERREAAAADA
jgi:GGDEF domain-containing protein